MFNKRAIVVFLGTMAVVATGVLAVTGEARAAEPASAQKGDGVAAPAISGMRIAFKLDPRLSGATYGGEHWVPATHYTGANGQDTVEALAQSVDGRGVVAAANAEWIPSDPAMVTVVSGDGGHVKITVHHAGASKLRVNLQGRYKELAVKAKYSGTTMQVEIDELAAEKSDDAAVAVPSPADFEIQKRKLSYAVGMSLAKALEKQSVEVDTDSLVQGLRDTLAGGKMLITDQELQTALIDLQASARNSQTSPASKALAERNKQEGQAFLATNRQKTGVVSLPSGLQYKIVMAGHGPRPTVDDVVVCKYRGTLIDGTEVDKGGAVTFALKASIKGWTEALQLMPVGSKWQLFVPSQLAYGERGASQVRTIGPNVTLIFDVELLSVQTSARAAASGAVGESVQVELRP